jgi:hypothetical protein
MGKKLLVLATAVALLVVAHGGLTPRRADAIVRANATRGMPWSVMVDIEGVIRCSGFALSRHWIVTAAHCVRDVPSPTQRVRVSYTDGAGQRQIAHPWARAIGYHGHPSDHPTEGAKHDIGLVHLGGDGVYPEVPAAPIYAEDEGLDSLDWRGDRRFVHHTGYGRGSPTSVPADCGDPVATTGTKRLGVSRLNGQPSPVLEGTPLAVFSQPEIGELCPGDSGSPWAVRSGFADFVFGVHSGSYPYGADRVHGATLLTPKLSWIQSVARAQGRPIECPVRTDQALRYRRCTEGRTTLPGQPAVGYVEPTSR